MTQEVFKRHELKFLLSRKEHDSLRKAILPYMDYDKYGNSEGEYNIVSLYYESFDKRIYYETVNKLRFRQKLRLRVYDNATLSSPSFIELKQKFKNVVNKRRTLIPLEDAYNILSEPYNRDVIHHKYASNPQILKEALHFKEFYNLEPSIVVSYDRQAFSGIAENEKDLRVTFDYNLMCRSEDLELENGPEGFHFVDTDTVILEVKVSNSVPFWLARILSDFNFTKQGFSKFCTSIDLLEDKRLLPLRNEVLT